MNRASDLIRSLVLLTLFALLSQVRAQEAPGEGLEPNPLSIPDAVRLFSLDQVTVVYPAGEGENVEVNRRSAQFRADYLKRKFGVDTQAAADDALSAAQKKGNLLVLGWTNRLLGTAEATRPFAKRERGFVFQGVEETDPSSELMFFTYSPFQLAKFLFFWSRIDPEIDRFQPLPFVGSNWAVLRDFLVVRQGMFASGFGWPPERNVNAEADQNEHLLEIEIERKIRHSAHYDIYYLPTVDIERDMDAIVEARESAYAKAVARLGEPSQGFRIRLSLYDDPADKKERCGVEDGAHSLPRKHEIHLIRRVALSPSAHEEIHVLARQKLGAAELTATYEGLAVAHDGSFLGNELDLLAAVMADRGEVPRLDDLFREANMRSLDDRTAFPASGLAVRFLRESAGDDRLARAFVLPCDAGLAGLAAALGSEPASLQASWERWIKSIAAARKSDLVFLRYQSDAQARYAAADYSGVAKALEKALRVKRDDPQTLFNLASARIRTGEYGKAEKNLRRIFGLTLPPRDAHLNAFSHYQLGRLYDVQGNREKAVAEYRLVLTLPDTNDSHRLANEALETPVTKDQLE